jgi:hypothetical protein
VHPIFVSLYCGQDARNTSLSLLDENPIFLYNGGDRFNPSHLIFINTLPLRYRTILSHADAQQSRGLVCTPFYVQLLI